MLDAKKSKWIECLQWLLIILALFPYFWTYLIIFSVSLVLTIKTAYAYRSEKVTAIDSEKLRRALRIGLGSIILLSGSLFIAIAFRHLNYSGIGLWGSPVRLEATSLKRGIPPDVFRMSATTILFLFVLSKFTLTKLIYELLSKLKSTPTSYSGNREQYHVIQNGVSQIHFYLTSASALMMIIIFVSSFLKLTFAFIGEASKKLPLVDVVWVPDHSDNQELIIQILGAIEILIVAPLPYLLMLGLGRYISEIANDNDAKRAKQELLDLKAFEVSLLIAIVATAMIANVLSIGHGGTGASLNLPTYAAAGILLALLIVYFYILETQEDKAAERKFNAYDQAINYLSEAEVQISQSNWQDAVESLEKALREFYKLPSLKDREKSVEYYCRGLRCLLLKKLGRIELDNLDDVQQALKSYNDLMAKLKSLAISLELNIVWAR